MTGYDYPSISRRMATGQIDLATDAPAIMALLGYEVQPHKRLGHACRKTDEGGDWQSLPNFRSADDAVLWLCQEGGELNDAGRNEDGTWYAGFEHPDYGNDFGDAPSFGGAIWVAAVRLLGRVGDD